LIRQSYYIVIFQPLFLYIPHQAVHSANGGTTEEALEAPQRYIDKTKHIEHYARRMYAGNLTQLFNLIGFFVE